jgi:hypothetical protein
MQPSARRRRPIAILVALVLLMTAVTPAVGASPSSGFWTERPAMLDPVADDVTVKALISVGDMVDGYRFESIPDGLAIWPRNRERVDLYVNHETSKVPFSALADYRNSEVSHLVIKRGSGKILSGDLVVPSSAGYQRFCSNFIAGAEAGFARPILFTNEEATDFVLRQEASWPVPAGQTGEQAGMVVAVDLLTGDFRSIPGMGRHNHENAVALPGYDQAVVLSGDDTFSAPGSQFYMYLAADGQAVWEDKGTLWAFQAAAPDASDAGTENDYSDVVAGESIDGRFIPVPDAVADGGQTGLENWSNDNNVFQFIRVEDIAYDRDDPNIVYFADTGEPRAIPQAAPGTRLARGPGASAALPMGTRGAYMNGRLWKMVLDADDPTIVTSLSILPGADFDAGGYSNPNVPHQPDNVETVPGGILFQEDPGGHNSGNPATFPGPSGFADATNARIWWYDLATGTTSVIAEVDQSNDAPTAFKGTWESSGIVDASWAFGPGAFLVTIQAHGVAVTPPGFTPPLDQPPMTEGGMTFRKRLEDGQLLLIRIPQD